MKAPLVVVAFFALFLPALAQGQEAKIAPGDVLLLSCEEEPTLNREYRVTGQGAILVDFLGAVFVRDLTEQEAAKAVKDRLVGERILREATIRVRIVKTKNDPVLFSGAVKTTGSKEFSPGLRLSDIVRLAQPTAEADLKRVTVKTKDGKQLVFDFASFDPATNENNPLLMPGDEVVFIGKKAPGSVTVLGGVGNPGVIVFEPGMTARKAIAKSGGFSSTAVLTKVRIEHEGRQPIPLDLSKQENDSPLIEGDRVFVETVEQRKYVLVSGAVKNGGYVELKPGLTLSKAVEAAGGPSLAGEGGRVLLIRAGTTKGAKYDLGQIKTGGSADPVLMPGDKVAVAGQRKRSNEGLKALSYLTLLYMFLGK